MLVRKVSALLGTLALVLTSLVVLPTVATAAPNLDIIVNDVEMSSTVGEGEQLSVGDIITVKGKWDATDANPHVGDTFTIGMPPELGFKESIPFDLIGPDGVVWGKCLTDPQTDIATCEITSVVEENSEFVHGTFEFDVVAEAVTEEKDLIFDLNGDKVAVPTPGTGGINDGVELPTDWEKTGKLNDNKWSMGWTIDLPGKELFATGKDTVTITEKLSSNHKLCEPNNLKVVKVRGDEKKEFEGTIEVTPGASDQEFSFELTKPEAGFDSDFIYRITYDTCTLNGEIDPKDTKYTNEAGFEGSTSGEIGVEQDWDFTGTVDKTGQVLGQADRNGKIAWNVRVSGDHLKDRKSFTLSDELSGPHKMEREGDKFVLRGVSVTERYGPSGTKAKEVTGELDLVVTPNSDGLGFTAAFKIKDDSKFEFKPYPYLYDIKYFTVATTDGLPAEGTAFDNKVTIEGISDESEAKVPGRTDRKAGKINASSVTIDNYDYLPQTTMNWDIIVPGERLQNVSGSLTVTDTFSASHMVCDPEETLEVGDDVTTRLDLKVQAVDQIDKGGLAPVMLTGVKAILGEDGLVTITVPEPSPELPGTLNGKSFSHEYQYVFSYTTCTATGGMDSPGTVYKNDATVAGKQYTSSTTQNNKGSGTGTGVTRGSVDLSKFLVENDAAGLVPADAVFTVHVKEIDPAGQMAVEYDLSVKADGTPVKGLNSRGKGWTIHVSEVKFPAVDGVTFGDPVFEKSAGVEPSTDGKTAIVSLVPGRNIAVKLTNVAQLGSLEVAKELVGGAADQVDPEMEYSFTAKIDTSKLGANVPAQPDRNFTLKVGESEKLGDLPIGATVTITETTPDPDDTFTWGKPVISPNPVVITAEHATAPAEVTVTNSVERTVGTFALTKTVTGEQADNPAVPKTVSVTATWEDTHGQQQSKELELPTTGEAVAFGEILLIGTEVTLTERPLEDGSSIAWGGSYLVRNGGCTRCE